MVEVPLLPDRTRMSLATDRPPPIDVPLKSRAVLAEPVVSPSKIWELLAAVTLPSTKAPDRIVALPEKMLAALRSIGVDAEFWMTDVTFGPMDPVIFTPTSRVVLEMVAKTTGVTPVPEYLHLSVDDREQVRHISD